MLDALNVDSTPGDLLPLLKIDGKCRFESRRGIWSVSCILCPNGAPMVKSQVDIADQKDSGRLLVKSELHNYTWPWSEEVEREKGRLVNLQRAALGMMKTGEGVKGTLDTLPSAIRTGDTCNLPRHE
jgi:hypothetical protein